MVGAVGRVWGPTTTFGQKSTTFCFCFHSIKKPSKRIKYYKSYWFVWSTLSWVESLVESESVLWLALIEVGAKKLLQKPIQTQTLTWMMKKSWRTITSARMMSSTRLIRVCKTQFYFWEKKTRRPMKKLKTRRKTRKTKARRLKRKKVRILDFKNYTLLKKIH